MCVLVIGSCAQHSQTSASRRVHPDLTIDCESRLCGSPVGLFVDVGHDEPMICSAALVGSELVVTASHCLGETPRCEDIWIAFPREGDSAHWVACKEIENVVAPDHKLMSPDYALLRIDRVDDRQPLVVSSEELPPGETVEMIAMTPDRFEPRLHAVESRRCRVGDPKLAAKMLGEDLAAVRWLDKCPVRLGNSGAPLLDANGNMRGLVHGGGPTFFAIALMTEVELQK